MVGCIMGVDDREAVENVGNWVWMGHSTMVT